MTLTVVSNTPPTLQLPASFTVEGNERNGAGVTWSAAATDSEDATAPTPTCSPASGSHFGLGTTSVSCSATDTGGLTATGSFDVTVADTTAPILSGVPASIETTTANADGTAVTFVPPTASDVVDPQPTATCSPASGATFPIGSTTVTCTSTDASGNHSSASFGVSVRLGQASFDAPIGPSNAVDANGSRSIPVKARLTLDGADVTTGAATLVVSRCGGGTSVRSVDLVWASARWTGKLDSSGLADGCWRASVVVGSAVLGGFDVNVPMSATASKAALAVRGDPRP